MVTLARGLRRALAMANGNPGLEAASMHPALAAREAGLRHVCDEAPGISRQRCGAGFRYLHRDGTAVHEPATLERIRRLAIPPAWRAVWICPRADGHLQATGRDARGRKQYRYHPRWRDVRDETKYGRVFAFARALPRIRRRVARDLALAGLPRAKALAAVVRLLETTLIRVGNTEYARENGSYGLTTLRGRQVRVHGARLQFEFRGKSGVQQSVELTDRRLAAIVKRMRELPGQELFQYLEGDGERRTIESGDVNAYLKEAAAEEFTSKDFRTWAGTLLCARELAQCDASLGRRGVAQAVEKVAAQLGNTRAVCRKCYIHPAVIESYLEGELQDLMRGCAPEAGLVKLLRRRLARERAAAKPLPTSGSRYSGRLRSRIRPPTPPQLPRFPR